MKAAIYTRVSSAMQLDGYSLEAQQKICRAFAVARGWEIVKIYTDEGVSAKTTARPQLQALLKDARARRFDVVIVHKLDRLSRSVTDILTILHNFEKPGVLFVSATEQFDFTTPVGKALLTMLAVFAQWYLDNLSAETKKGKKARAEAGHWSGGDVPFGYTVHYKKDGGDGLAYPHPEDTQGVKLAFEQYATGNLSDYDIAVLLNERGYRPRGRGNRALPLFSKDTVSRILKNRFYLGEVSYKENWHPGLHKAIITEDLFNRAQNARRSRRSTPAVKARKGSRVYILSGIAYCARCKQPLRGWSAHSYRYYRDSAKERMIKCDQKSIRADKAEASVGRYLSRLQLPEDWRDQIITLLKVDAGPVTDIKRKKSALSKQLERLKNLYEWGDITAQEYRRKQKDLQTQINALTPPELPDFEAAALLSDFGLLWQAATPQERKLIVKTLLKAVYLDSGADGPLVAIEPKPEYAQLFALFLSDQAGAPVAPAQTRRFS